MGLPCRKRQQQGCGSKEDVSFKLCGRERKLEINADNSSQAESMVDESGIDESLTDSSVTHDDADDLSDAVS